MRTMIVALGLAAFTAWTLAVSGGPATAAKSKMGCEVGKEYWDASQGKCLKGSKPQKKSAKKGDKE